MHLGRFLTRPRAATTLAVHSVEQVSPVNIDRRLGHPVVISNPLILTPALGANHRSAQVLILLVVPGHVIFLYTIHLMKSGHTTLTPIFMSVYLATALLQVSFSLSPLPDGRDAVRGSPASRVLMGSHQ